MHSTDSPVRLVAVDLDGTLLPDNHEPSPRDLAAIRRVQQQGVVVVICTGRPYSSADPVAARLGLMDTPIVSYNGAVIRMPGRGETLRSLTVEPALAAEIVSDCVQQGLHLHYYRDGVMYVTRMSKWAWRYYRRTGVRPVPAGDLRKFAGQRPTKILLVDDPSNIAQLLPEAQQRYAGRAYVTSSMPQYCELLPPQATKAEALRWLAEYYSLAMDQTMAIGDGLNDLPMIQSAGVGVAMAGSHEALHSADYITESQTEGVAEALDRFVA